VLIVVLGVLVILALLATTFATLQQLDRTVSRNYVDDVRAKMLAQSGVEYGISEIRDMMSNGFFSAAAGSGAWVYYGDQTDETQPPNPATPVELAKNPSWAREIDGNPISGSPAPKLLTIRRPNNSTADIGFTAAHANPRYAANGDVYSLRVVDASGMIYVNDGLYQYSGNNSTVSLNLKRILNNLGKHPTVQIQNLGDKILAARGSGYISKYDLRKAVNYNDAEFNKFRDFVTTNAWVDKNVVNPVPLSSAAASSYPINYWRGNQVPVYRRGRGYNNVWDHPLLSIDPNWSTNYPLKWYQPGNASLIHNGFYGHDELFPQYVEVVWRAPVNLNTAPEPVLSALIADVEGFFAIERRRFQPYTGSPKDMPYTGIGYNPWSPPTNWISFTIPQSWYTWMYVAHTFSSEGTGGDEIGHLYRTAPLFGPWAGTVSGGVSAKTIADHIIKCRAKGSITSSKNDGSGGSVTIDYATKPFGGPFKNWAQFYAFLTYLVESGILWDSRTIYGDFKPGSSVSNANWPETFTQAAAGSANNKFASYALADALKANFNPNCILNETNPDRNMYLRVDKTDLIVNSTEFCFTPMGFYELESLGRVLQPENGAGDALTPGVVNQVVAEKKIIVTIKLYDAYRESTQRHFYGGTLALRQTTPETNNNRALEIGPEVDNGPLVYTDYWGMGDPDSDGALGVKFDRVQDGYAGPAPTTAAQNVGWGYEYSGYIALPTLGSNWLPGNFAGTKPKGSLWSTGKAPAPHLGSVIHTHFTWDFKAHWHQSAEDHNNDWFRDEVGSVDRYATQYLDVLPYPFSPKPKKEKTLNYPDRGEPVFSPYCTQYDPKYRLARSFRLPVPASGSGTTSNNLNLQPYAPSDLRIDGGYSERHSGIAYWMDNGISWNEEKGMMAAWVKPSFYPEFSGKMRKVFSMSRWHNKNYDYRNPNLWDMFYMPAHDALPYSNSGTHLSNAVYQGWPKSTGADHPPEAFSPWSNPNPGKGVYPFRPMSFNTTWGLHCFDGSLADFDDEGPWLEEENYSCTPSLNHRLHGSGTWNGEAGQPNYLDKGKWTHVILRWQEKIDWYVNTDKHWIETYINGEKKAATSINGTTPFAGEIFTSSKKHKYFTIQSFAEGNKWLSNTLRLGECSYHGFGTFPRNYSADMTYDELYVWANNSDTHLGYAQTKLWGDGRYYKPGLGTNSYTDGLYTSATINLDQVSPSRSLVPSSSTATPPYTTSSGGSSTVVVSSSSTKKRLLGVAWTCFAEDYAANTTSLIPVMYDYQNSSSPTPLQQIGSDGKPVPIARVFILADGQKFPLNDAEGYRDDGFSQIVDANQKPLTLTDATNIKYQVWFKILGMNASTVLLATPYFEDITLFYDTGDVEFLLYALVNTV